MIAPLTPLDDVVDVALSDLSDVTEHSIADQRSMVKQIRQMRLSRRRGKPWSEILAAGAGPGLLSLSGRVIARLIQATGRVKRAMARTLRSEGLGLEEIGRLLGVTHQRVSHLLARSPAAPEPGSTEPASR